MKLLNLKVYVSLSSYLLNHDESFFICSTFFNIQIIAVDEDNARVVLKLVINREVRDCMYMYMYVYQLYGN